MKSRIKLIPLTDWQRQVAQGKEAMARAVALAYAADANPRPMGNESESGQ